MKKIIAPGRAALSGTLLLLLNTIVHADTGQTEPVVVTATRTAQTVDGALASVSVITREQIRKSNARDVMDLLRLESGIDVARNGGPGQLTNIFMRGTNSNHVLVLIDGVRAASATTGTFAWTHMPAAQIERIEIVRGPRASLYGSEAIGGVIQIFTRKPESPTASIEAGSYGTVNTSAGLVFGDERRLTMNVEHRSADGFSAQNAAGFGFNPDDDGYDNTSLSASLLAPIDDNLTFQFDGWASAGETEFDEGTTDSYNHTVDVTINTRSSDIWTHTLRFGHAADHLDTESAFPSEVVTRRRMAEWQNDLSVGDDSLLTLGISYIRDKARNIDTGANTTVFDEATTNRAVFGNWQSAFGANDYQLSVRLDDHDAFGNETTGAVAWGRNTGERVRLLASYGTAFRGPTINELYHPGFGGFFAGNPDLDPETSQTLELGTRIELPADARIEFNLYRTRVDELIAFQGTNSQAINLDEATIDGLEASYFRVAGQWSYTANVTWQDARDEATGDKLVRRPDRKLAVRAQREFGSRTFLATELLASSERPDIGGTTLPGYGIVNLSLGYSLTNEFVIEARAENVFDKDYELASGFNTPGASGFIGVRYTRE